MSRAGATASPAVKICGVCSATDAAYATSAGASYIGVILAPGRSRSRTMSQAAAIFDACGVRRVGVFVDESLAGIAAAIDRLRLDVVQLHGDEEPDAIQALVREGGVEVWKACRVRSPGDVARASELYDAADGLLLDGWSPHAHGGVGATFDWAAVAAVSANLTPAQKLIVAGGLGPGNVALANMHLRPDVVDVSSGVETAPGTKSAELIDAFIAAARPAGDGI